MMRRRLIAAIAIFLSLTLPVLAQTGARIWNFDSDKKDQAPKDFTVIMGDWKIVSDPTDPSEPNVVAQLAKNSGSTFNLILADGTSYQDIDISVLMRPVEGTEDQGGGVVWRAKDGKNYYVARFNPLEDNFNLYKVENGRRTELKGATLKARPGWHILQVKMKGDHIECYLDDKKYLDTRDSTFMEPGEIGLWTKSDAQTHFDDLKVSTAS